MKKLITICAVAAMLAIGSTANAHWDSSMPYKMHYPQLPDPYGWDVSLTNASLADDWQCSENGDVKDIHLWFSIKGYNSQELPELPAGPNINVSIYSNIFITPPEGSESYSLPKDLLWSRTFTDSQYDAEYAGSGNQGWFNPVTQEAVYPDHTAYYLLNIENIDAPWKQVAGTIYWLGISLSWPTEVPSPPEMGWKTSNDHFMDDAAWSTAGAGWQPDLEYPSNDPLNRDGQSIDLAFVITPEPATVALLTLGGLAMLRRRNRFSVNAKSR
jgi:hypothetical protein